MLCTMNLDVRGLSIFYNIVPRFVHGIFLYQNNCVNDRVLYCTRFKASLFVFLALVAL